MIRNETCRAFLTPQKLIKMIPNTRWQYGLQQQSKIIAKLFCFGRNFLRFLKFSRKLLNVWCWFAQNLFSHKLAVWCCINLGLRNNSDIRRCSRRDPILWSGTWRKRPRRSKPSSSFNPEDAWEEKCEDKNEDEDSKHEN